MEVRVQAAFAGLLERLDHRLQVVLMILEGPLILAARAYVSCGKTL